MGNDLVAEGLAESVLSVHYMVARYPTGRPMYALCAGCEWSDSFGSVNEARTAHARHVVDVLRSNDVEVIDAVRVYAAAALNSDGEVQPVSTSFETPAQAGQDLAGLLGDDYFRDRQPFVATAIVQKWRPLEPATVR
ncbi:hypothetical protein AN480_27795 (plasmid) [Mycobacterium intracellulare subsp. chimaera]|uniref:Uncharacterized protein n=1 Tax=Mycobacterium intracellulare subsp. chimaera TaxID=222805 RepID=A0ABT7P7K6_MYCIT|nr:hypothetical protein [Mycobacterium intracellulare]AOS94878.1 hypothetical protein AN480_27795 [Mycobacterium intracellulare subsp. chimaera]MDM3929271.1 hypothetical protein [Mycobacterium intracellulare subsp. chimaera]